jgi:hypothetical protein
VSDRIRVRDAQGNRRNKGIRPVSPISKNRDHLTEPEGLRLARERQGREWQCLRAAVRDGSNAVLAAQRQDVLFTAAAAHQ